MGLCRRCWTIYSTQVWAYRARAQQPFLSFINRALAGHFSGPGSISGSHKKEMFLFAPQIKRKGSLSSWPIYILFSFYIINGYKKKENNQKIRCLLTGCSSLSTLLRRPVRERLLHLWKIVRMGYSKRKRLSPTLVEVSGWVSLAYPRMLCILAYSRRAS